MINLGKPCIRLIVILFAAATSLSFKCAIAASKSKTKKEIPKNTVESVPPLSLPLESREVEEEDDDKDGDEEDEPVLLLLLLLLLLSLLLELIPLCPLLFPWSPACIVEGFDVLESLCTIHKEAAL